MVEVLKVSSKSNPNSVAGALAGVLRQTGAVEVQVVGAGALNQAIKAIAIARGFVAPSNLDLVCIPTFADILIDGQSRTAIRLAVEDRARRKPEPLTEVRGAATDGIAATAPSPAMAAADGLAAHGLDSTAPVASVTTTTAATTATPAPTVVLTANASALAPGSVAGLAVEPAVGVVTADIESPSSSEPVLT